jgi:peptidoglycan L-alanyl-D-glutamate endopeptidase CwlK
MFSNLLLSKNIIIDSDMTFQEAIEGTNAPQEVIDELVLIDVEYYSFDGKLHKGQLVMHKDTEQDITEIFEMIKEKKFPVNKCIPIVEYNWSDNASMDANNSSGFNYRFIAGTKRLSNHSFGRAVDINPFQNPVIYNDGKISPDGATFDISKPGTFSASHFIVEEFRKRGWRWGGDWTSLKDNHHFDKPE